MKSLIFFIVGLLITALVYAAQFYTVGSRHIYTINEWSVCKDVKNSLANSLFVPTNTSAEWTALQNNPPANVQVLASTNCSCDGKTVLCDNTF